MRKGMGGLRIGILLGNAGILGRACILVLGCVFPVYGMTIVIRSDAGTAPNDLVALVISEKARFRFSLTRIAVDAAFTLLGWLLCGTAGIGTLIYMFLVGPAAEIFLPVNGRIIDRWVEKALRP